MQPADPLVQITLLLGAVILGLGLLFGRAFFAVLFALLVYDLIKALFRLPFWIGRWLRMVAF